MKEVFLGSGTSTEQLYTEVEQLGKRNRDYLRIEEVIISDHLDF